MHTDVFISFKNSDFSGNPTEDSKIAKALYEELVSRGIAAQPRLLVLRTRLYRLGKGQIKGGQAAFMQRERI